jgi:hypothetical protein
MSVNYLELVTEHLNNAIEPISPSHIYRAAVEAGATESSTKVISSIRKICECLSSSTNYRRLKTKGIKGYQYEKKAV